MAPISRQSILGQTSDSPKLQDQYRLGEQLGKGAFGVVYSASDLKTGQAFACKSIAKAKLVCDEDIEDVHREVEVLNLVGDHPNIAELKATFEDSQAVHLVLELCKGGELFDRICAKGTFSEKQAAAYFRTMVEVVSHCHQLGVIHRDIKPENFLLTTTDDTATLKAADFGLCTYFKPGDRFTTVVGSAYYVAPEVLRKNYSHEADMWSLGVILYILLCGMPPFWGDTEEDIFRMILKGTLDFQTAPWPSISEAAKDCVRRLLTLDPSKRATAAQILQHPWLQAQGVAPDHPLDNIVIERMRKFAAMNKLKKAALLVIAKTMSPAEISGLHQLFKSIDTDSSGTISINELKEALDKMGSKIGDTELAQVMEAADLDGDGVIDYEEFVASTTNLNKLEKEEFCLQAFKHFDKDNSGFLTLDELQEGLRSFSGTSPADIEALLQNLDTNHDGMIDYQEFLAMMRANNSGLQEASNFLKGLRVPESVLQS